MNISRFFGITNREALRQVRLALGPDALIVSNRRVNGGVEILATDPTSVPQESHDTVAAGQSTQPAQPVAARAAAPVPPPRGMAMPPAGAAQAGGDLMGAIGDMRGALENRIDELLWGNQLRRAPQAVSLFQTLLGLGFSTALLRAMLKRLPEQLTAKAAFQWARHELVTHLPVLRSEDELWVPGLALALVGPTGVGKTTTIAKLAARCVKRTGPDSLVLLTTDTYRIGAHEQLKIYGQMLRVPVHVVQDVADLRRIVQAIRPDQTILIDNVGISQRDRYISEQAAMLAGSGRLVQRLLVLNASSHGDTLDEVARTYANDGGSPLKGCIITKIDEASRLGASLDTAIRYQLPVHYVSNGQKVPENLLFMQASELVDQAVSASQQGSALYAPTEADFAALMSLAKAPGDDAATRAADSRRKLLLPGLLAAVGGTNVVVPPESLEAAKTYIDEDVACSEAYDLWRAASADGAKLATAEALNAKLLRVVQSGMGEKRYATVLAVHDHTSLRAVGQAPGALRATVLLSESGTSLVTTQQQLSFPDGWRSSCGVGAALAPPSAEALLHQIESLTQRAGQMPLVHLFEATAPGIWHRCSALGVTWLAQVTAKTRLWRDDGATIAGAIAKALDYRPVGDLAHRLELSELVGLPLADVSLWVASTSVAHVARQQAPLALQLLCVRVVNRHDGSLIKLLLGVRETAGSAVHVSDETAAAWMVARWEAKFALRHAARAWAMLAQGGRAESRQIRAVTAVQLGMAAWAMKQAPNAGVLRDLAGALTGKPSLPTSSTVPALLKLFALKEMLS